MAFQHQAGTAMECLSVCIVYEDMTSWVELTIIYDLCLSLQIPITLHKEKDYDQEGREILKCGFKIGGGIDQDYKKSPQGYTDYVGIWKI